jgi:hypothetical protein
MKTNYKLPSSKASSKNIVDQTFGLHTLATRHALKPANGVKHDIVSPMADKLPLMIIA